MQIMFILEYTLTSRLVRITSIIIETYCIVVSMCQNGVEISAERDNKAEVLMFYALNLVEVCRRLSWSKELYGQESAVSRKRARE